MSLKKRDTRDLPAGTGEGLVRRKGAGFCPVLRE